MKRKVWLVSHYAMPPHLEMRVKTLRFARYLQDAGYDVLLVTASTIHNTDINLIQDKSLYIEKEYDGLKFVHIRCDQYRGNGVKRVLNLFQFQRNFCKAMKNFDKPDVIVADCNCINYSGIYKFAKNNDIKFISEIRDLWPLSIVEYLHFSNNNPIIRYLYGREKRMYRVSDAIIFSMEGGKDYIIEKGWNKVVDTDKVFHINNGVDVREQEVQIQEFVYEDADLADSSTFKVLYVGSIRQANNVSKIVDVAQMLQRQGYDKIKFIIFGDGTQRQELEERCRRENIDNVMFKGKVDKKYIPNILSHSNLNILNYKDADTWKYGGSQNKMFEYMASGRPILSTIKMGYSIINKYNCGVEAQNQEVETLAQAIKSIYDLPQEQYQAMCHNAKMGAKDYDYDILSQKLIEVIEYAMTHEIK